MRTARRLRWICGAQQGVRLGVRRFLLVVLSIGLGGSPLAAQRTRTDSAALDLVERAAVRYGSARTLRANFEQVIISVRGGVINTASGEFLQRGARQFAFRFASPPEDRIVADGAVLWLYLPSSMKGQVLKVPRGVGAGLDIASSLLKEPRRRYTVTALPDTTIESLSVRVVRLVPRTPDAPFTKAILWLDPKSALIRQTEITEPSGLVRRIRFSKIRSGVSIPADAFTFVPPAGVRVIDQAAMMGGSSRP